MRYHGLFWVWMDGWVDGTIVSWLFLVLGLFVLGQLDIAWMPLGGYLGGQNEERSSMERVVGAIFNGPAGLE